MSKTKLHQANHKAMLTNKAVKGIEKILSADNISFLLAHDPDIVSAFRYLKNTVELFNSPLAIEKRKKAIENKNKWRSK